MCRWVRVPIRRPLHETVKVMTKLLWILQDVEDDIMKGVGGYLPRDLSLLKKEVYATGSVGDQLLPLFTLRES